MQTIEAQRRTPFRKKTHPFDSLAFAKSMESVGFTRQQAEKMAEEQAKLIEERLATKEDIEQVNANIKITAEQAKTEILKWVLGSVAGQTVVLLAGMIGILHTGTH
jgi:2-phosphoglycerate kinase